MGATGAAAHTRRSRRAARSDVRERASRAVTIAVDQTPTVRTAAPPTWGSAFPVKNPRATIGGDAIVATTARANPCTITLLVNTHRGIGVNPATLEGVDEELTVEDLAREAGVPVSTVRLYQSRGLLPSPERKGRVAYYGPGHVARMHLIGRLQQDGFSLASIKQLVQAWEEGRGLPELLGLEERVAGWDREAVEVSPAELASLMGGADLTPDVLAHAQRLGLVRVGDDGTLTVPDLELLRVGAELISLGVPAGEVLDEYEALLGTVRPATDRFVALFERHFLAPVESEGFTPAGVRALTETLDQLRQLATRVVAAAMRQAFADAASAKLAELASTMPQETTAEG